MPAGTVYLDNQSTTRVDPRVVEAMSPFWSEKYGNAGSTGHVFGHEARDAVEHARQRIAVAIGANAAELVLTSGATESNNLAIRGAVLRRQAPGKHLVSVVTEHRAVLDPLARMAKEGCEVTLLPVRHAEGSAPQQVGQIDLDQLSASIRDDTALVSVMLANNEIGTIQPLRAIAEVCHQRGTLLHCDATQAVGKIPVDVTDLGVDLLSFSAHKLYGPKGVGVLYVARRTPRIRLVPLIDGGGQERGLRSGTLAVPLIVGFARAVELCVPGMDAEMVRLHDLRQRLYDGLTREISDCVQNGPAWDEAQPLVSACRIRLPHNLNLRFGGLEGESLMIQAADIAVSSGSACTSASPEPSHVLRAIGLTDDQVRSSLRFGLGRFTSEADIDCAIESLAAAARRLRGFR